MPRRYGFRHPIVRSAVYGAASEAWRLRAHARVAAALADRPRALAARAHHLELCAPVGDEAAVAVLEQAGHEAAPRAPAVAAKRFAAALRLLEGESDDGTAGRRLGLLIALASAEAATGRLEGALERLQEALASVDPGAAELRGALVVLCAACENLLGRHDAAHSRLLRGARGAARPAGRDRLAARRAGRRRALRQRLRDDGRVGRRGAPRGGRPRRAPAGGARRRARLLRRTTGSATRASATPRGRAAPR